MEALVNAVLLTLLAVVTIAIVKQRNLFGVVLLAGISARMESCCRSVISLVGRRARGGWRHPIRQT